LIQLLLELVASNNTAKGAGPLSLVASILACIPFCMGLVVDPLGLGLVVDSTGAVLVFVLVLVLVAEEPQLFVTVHVAVLMLT